MQLYSKVTFYQVGRYELSCFSRFDVSMIIELLVNDIDPINVFLGLATCIMC